MVDPSAQTTHMPEAHPAPCSGCEAQRLSPLACGSCGKLSEPETHPSPFQLFGFAPTWTVCPAELRKRLMRITRLTHPDLHAEHDSSQAQLAEHHTAQLNEAYRLLLDDVERTEWLIEYLGGPPASKGVPQDLLMEVMEWNETLDDVEHAGEAAASSALATLDAELQTRKHQVLQGLRTLLDPLPEPNSPVLTQIREQLDVLRYLVRILERTKALQTA
ncbi:MAG: hypothetical protein H6830_12050 [Planctomycetes bacterium]|nr:hypothetical protein [Planctomycetota bacterium]MCB9910812.1 hypothetical protein [Planctomycetota bacterium]MCB9912256.1 hypothetical protein [Planctomycetota bacterium]HPF12787.1 iron-sulfur cluster co-chaperone HscB C-terminal domain-containing protein [Planctomycetota bacterium]HRV80446.1 iron-sulfur cluster co-chaperone HscB C-terminal domain-containing protein [Planctomycetota bacterium]